MPSRQDKHRKRSILTPKAVASAAPGAPAPPSSSPSPAKSTGGEEFGRVNNDLKNLLESTQIATILLDHDLRIRRFTPPALAILNLVPADVGRPLPDIAAKHDHPTFVEDTKKVLEDFVPRERELRTRDGRVHFTRILPYRTTENVIDGVVVTFVDITKLVAAREEIESLSLALRYRVAELETMLNLIPIGILWSEDPAGREIHLNRSGAELAGVSETTPVSPIGGEPPFALFQGERKLDPAEHPIQAVLATGKPLASAEEFRLVRRDGRAIDVAIAAAPLLDGRGKVRGGVAVLADVTERNRQRQEIEARAHRRSAIARLGFYATAESDVEELMKEAAAIAAQTLEVELAEVLEVDPAQQRLVRKAGLGWASLAGTPTLPINRETPAGLAFATRERVVIEDLQQESLYPGWWLLAEHGVVSGVSVVIAGRPAPFGVLSVYARRQRRFNEDDIDFLQSVASLISSALIRDRVQSALLATQRQLAFAESEDKARRSQHLVSLGTLAAGIAHEITNPLNAILVNAEYGQLALEREDRALANQSLQTIAEQAKRCGEITTSVLAFSRAEGGPKAIHDLNEVIRRSVELASSYLQFNDATVEFELDDKLPPLKLNPTTMEHAVVNLLRNAAECGMRGVRIRVRSERAGSFARLTIADNGPGILAGPLKRIFDPFFTTRREQGGSGLGLSIVYRIVTDHAGIIDVRSAPGEGATFVIDLPLPEDA